MSLPGGFQKGTFMDHTTDGNEKGLLDFIGGAALVYGIFVIVVGALFTLMLLFGKPVEEV